MKKKKGFTLIELLAVIVVLAIIALIATPIVMNTIEKSKKGAAERSADNYIDAVEIAAATSKLDGEDIPDGTYQIDEEGNLLVPSLPSGKLTVDMNGNKPSGGTTTISNGQLTTDSKMTIGGYDVAYNEDNKKYEATKKTTPSVEVLCKPNTKKANAFVWGRNGDPSEDASYEITEVGLLASETTSKYDIGVTYTCELGDGQENVFYVLETNGDNVSLIAGFFIIDTIVWLEENEFAPVALKDVKAVWTKLDENKITLPTAKQIATAAGKTFDENEYIDGYDLRESTWLYSSINAPLKTGYFTGSSINGEAAWIVDYEFILKVTSTDYTVNDAYVRPVITISKSQLQ